MGYVGATALKKALAMPEREAAPELYTVTIDGRTVRVEKGSTVLEAARQAGVAIPTLCHHPAVQSSGACRVCVVEVKGARTLVASCVYPVADGMVVSTNNPTVREARRTVVELLMARHGSDCLVCERNNDCELQAVARLVGARETRFVRRQLERQRDDSSPALVRDTARCILCGRCVRVCHELQGVGAINFAFRGERTTVGPALFRGLGDVACVACGQCAAVCPVGAIYEKSHVASVWKALADPHRHVVAQVAPAVRVALGEEFGLPPGTRATGKVAAALRRLGFRRVFDTQFAADLTIMEEGHEFLRRLKGGGKLPLITSCSPGWIKFCEHFYPDMLENLSTCKSPQQMLGALVKTYYARKQKLLPGTIYSVSVMPCTAKKFEATRPEMSRDGQADVDAVLTTRELARMIREAGINFETLPDERFDAPMGISTGAATIFGVTGGVMEAALRSVYEWVTGEELKHVEFEDVRGFEGVRETSLRLKEKEVRLAVAHGLANARRLLEAIRKGERQYHFVEIMACPSGCIGGGGQPRPLGLDTEVERARALYAEDGAKSRRKSHRNPALKMIYREFLGEPGGRLAHRLLHTVYTRREPQ